MTVLVEGSAGVVPRSVSDVLEAGVQPGSVVCAALSDGPVTGWLVVEETAAAGVERQCAVVGLENCSVVSAGPVSEVKLAGDPVPTADAMPAWAPALAGEFWAARRARAEAEASRAALTAHQARLERIVDAAHEYADANDLCERFDNFMQEQGLRPRSHDYIVELDVTVRVRVRASGQNADAAAGQVGHFEVAEQLAGMNQQSLYEAVQDSEVVDTEEA